MREDLRKKPIREFKLGCRVEGRDRGNQRKSFISGFDVDEITSIS